LNRAPLEEQGNSSRRVARSARSRTDPAGAPGAAQQSRVFVIKHDVRRKRRRRRGWWKRAFNLMD